MSQLIVKVNVSTEVRPSVNREAFISHSQPSAQHIVGTTLFHLKEIYLVTLKKKKKIHSIWFFLDNPYGIILFLQHIS